MKIMGYGPFSFCDLAMTVDLTTNLLNWHLKTPLIVSSGPMTMNGLDAVRAAGEPIGAVVMKAVTPKARGGYPQPHWIWFGDSLLNAQGNPNPGYERFVEDVRYTVENSGIPVIVSLIASEPEEYLRMAETLKDADPHAFELPLMAYRMDDPRWAADLVKAVKEAVNVPVIAKLWYDVQIVDVGYAVVEAGADAITAIGSIPALAIDLSSASPKLGSPYGYGGLTGPCIKPLAVRCISVLAKSLDVPIIGGGGVSTASDVLEMMMAGAHAVGLLTAVMRDGLEVFGKICVELQRRLSELDYRRVEDVVGVALDNLP
jgi:dihydroorotate dehydrogenase (NAD+) catalytic subunit